MIDSKELKEKIKKTGFSCMMCGQCCSRLSENSNLVIVSAPEIRRIIEGTGLLWEEIAEPYPDILNGLKGEKFTFAWCLKRDKDKCRFLNDESGCLIYEFRPLICRTYPFMLDDSELLVFDCPGIGVKTENVMAEIITNELIERAGFEQEEFEKIKEVFSSASLSGDKMNIIDSEGVKIIE